MGNGLIAAMLAVGAATWIYTKVNRTSGGNTQSSLTVAAISGVCIFIAALLLLGLIPK